MNRLALLSIVVLLLLVGCVQETPETTSAPTSAATADTLSITVVNVQGTRVYNTVLSGETRTVTTVGLPTKTTSSYNKDGIDWVTTEYYDANGITKSSDLCAVVNGVPILCGETVYTIPGTKWQANSRAGQKHSFESVYTTTIAGNSTSGTRNYTGEILSIQEQNVLNLGKRVCATVKYELVVTGVDKTITKGSSVYCDRVGVISHEARSETYVNGALNNTGYLTETLTSFSTSTATPTSAAPTTTPKPIPSNQEVLGTAFTVNSMKVTVKSVDPYISDMCNSMYAPQSCFQEQTWCAMVDVENVGDSVDYSPSPLEFEVIDTGKYTHTGSSFTLGRQDGLNMMELKPGLKTLGSVCFDLPQDNSPAYISYTDSPFLGQKVTVTWLIE